jgi:hypothetical protein
MIYICKKYQPVNRPPPKTHTFTGYYRQLTDIVLKHASSIQQNAKSLKAKILHLKIGPCGNGARRGDGNKLRCSRYVLSGEVGDDAVDEVLAHDDCSDRLPIGSVLTE